MAVATLTIAECPVCGGDIPQEESTVVHELIDCDDCGSELEVTSLSPFALMESPQAEEDWGQ